MLPFGLKNAPGTSQRFMANDVLVGYLQKFCKVYLDDILIYSATPEEHIGHLRKVLERLGTHHLKVSPAKCSFAVTELDYLGHHLKGSVIVPLDNIY